MPTVEITEEQHEYLETLRDRLAADHVGRYGHVRYADAIQFLIDVAEGETTAGSDVSGAEGVASGTATGQPTMDGDAEAGTDRLSAMMQLLETHEDKWEEAEGEDARYAVELPDGTTEHVRTRDDVRAVLFKHYV